MFHLHWPFGKKNDPSHPTDLMGHRCPLVGGDDDRALGVCRIFAILHRQTMRCDGYHPPDICPLANGNDVIVSYQKQSKLIVGEN